MSLLATAQMVAEVEVNPWSLFPQPIPASPAQVYGKYQSGCMLGAQTLAERGRGYETVNRSRNRFYGFPSTIQTLETWGAWLDEELQAKMIVGDISQPVGGPSTTGHASHQVGLDTDIRFLLLPQDKIVEDPINNYETPPLVSYTSTTNPKGVVTPHFEFLEKNWDARFLKFLEKIGTDASVERIFINPPIKRFLCQKLATTDATKTGSKLVTNLDQFIGSTTKVESPFQFPLWLKKFRPESGHVSHFHVRMSCPAENKQCISQDPVPTDGTDASLVGCSGATLNQWFEQAFLKKELNNPESSPTAPKPGPPAVPYWKTVITNKAFPSACKDLIKDQI